MKCPPLYRLLLALPFWVALVSQPAQALEDIDLYSGTGGGVAAPNVLFFVDNSSNWVAAKNDWNYRTVMDNCGSYSGTKLTTCRTYVNQLFCSAVGSSTTACNDKLSLPQGQIEIRALMLVLNEAYCNASGSSKLNFNAGLMLLNDAGTVEAPQAGGYIRHAIRPMSADQCLTSVAAGADLTKFLMADLAAFDANINVPAFKSPSNAEYAAPLYEAFKYFGGWTNPARSPGGVAGGAVGVAGTPTGETGFGPIRYSKAISTEDSAAFADGGKTTYKSPLSDSETCGNNYIILIGNAWPNGEQGTSSDRKTNQVMTRLGYSPAQLYEASPNSNTRFADEWAQFLYSTDVSSASGKQNVKMFTIDVFNKAPDLNQSQLLLSMANAGQGTTDGSGYFKVGGDLFALINSLKDILSQIASVNSVFASAALPVSVNAQGTYLNQVFMGLFRPDEDSQQRWYGNLKQYKFALTKNSAGAIDANSSLFLADSTGKAAVDSANTGFISNCAISYWSGDSANYWEKITGTPSSCSTQTTKLYSDLPDGPIVERGGAAQKLRELEYANRNMRTCGSATSCNTTSLVDFNSGTTGLLTAIASATGLSSTDSTTLLNWTRGQNTGDGVYNSASGTSNYTQYLVPNSDGVALTGTSTRPTVHGEVVHSTPLAVNYGSGGTGSGANDVVVFYGAGDGTFRALDGNQTTTDAGKELWAFIAPEHWSKLDRVRTNSPLISYPNVATTLTPTPAPKSYFFDGPITGYQDGNGSSRRLWIYSAMRRGGNMVYAFDVSAKPSSTNQPKFLWKFGCASAGTGCPSSPATGEDLMGQSWSAPTVIKVKGITDGSSNEEPLVVFGGGYDACEDNEDANTACTTVTRGKGIYVMSSKQGKARNYRYIAPSSTYEVVPGRFTADITPVDVNGDGYTDLIYAVDTRGNVWRINTSNPNATAASGTVAATAAYDGYPDGVEGWPSPQLIAKASNWAPSGEDAERRKFMYAPSVVTLSTSQTLVLLGSGDREKPSSTSRAAAVNNRFYGFKDSFKTTTGVVPLVGYGAMTTGTDLLAPSFNSSLMNVTGKSSVNLTTLAVMNGWVMNLYSSSPFEQVVTTPLTIAGVTYFNTYQAKSDKTCSLGTARGYQLDFQTGVEKPNSAGELAPVVYLTQGMPTSPRGGSVDIDGTTYPFCISCASSDNSTILNPIKPKVKLKPNRTPIYRYQRIDGK